MSQLDKLLQDALQQRDDKQRQVVFNPERPDLEPTDTQFEILQDNEHNIIHCLGGNRCLSEDTLVLTPYGARPINCIKKGDTVFDEDGYPIQVEKTFFNGKKDVYPIYVEGENEPFAWATKDHKFLVKSKTLGGKRVAVGDFKSSTLIQRVVDDEIIYVNVKVGDDYKNVYTYDIHVNSATNFYCLANGIVTSNSGKTQLGARILTWWFENNHPYMERPEKWGKGPLTLLMLGKVSTLTEVELFEKKIKPYLTPGCWKQPHRQGGTIQWVEHKTNGNRIVFISHHNPKAAREKAQGYAAHFIWTDEMSTAELLSELMMRMITTDGHMFNSFTPLIINEKVRKMVDGASGLAKKYMLNMLDNPLIKNDPKAIQLVMDSMSHLSEAERNTRLNGDWYMGTRRVYEFNEDIQVRALPAHYDPYSWRMVLTVDPAASGVAGTMTCVEDPHTGDWYMKRAEYVKDTLNTADLIEKCEAIRGHISPMRRIVDSANTWYTKDARSMGLHYTPVIKKKDRKADLIKGLQTGFDSRKFFVTPDCPLFIDEVTSCMYSETVENKIVGASNYHLLDCAQYFWEMKPHWEPADPTINGPDAFYARIMSQHKQRKAIESSKKEINKPFRIRVKRWK